jgi:hypothetical protein
MNRKLLFLPAWDKTDLDPKKDCGVSCLDMKFLVIGANGIVEFDLGTNWYQDHVVYKRVNWIKESVLSGKKDFLIKYIMSPFPTDICYYSRTRLSEDDILFENGWSHLEDMSLVYYGYRYREESDGLWTTDYVLKLLVENGDEVVWNYLENYYIETFGEE